MTLLSFHQCEVKTEEEIEIDQLDKLCFFPMAGSGSGSGYSSTSIADKCMKSMSSLFSCPRLFTSFTSKKVLHETEAAGLSPTSILDSKPCSAFMNPFGSEANSPTTTVGEHSKRFWDKLDHSKGLVDALIDDYDTHFSKSPTVLFGSQLIRIQTQQSQSPKSSSDFGVSVQNPVVGNESAFGSASSALETNNSNSPGVFSTRCLSLSEMEISEDYTRVISHGPNPRTTHIFDNCIIQTNCFDNDVPEFPASAVESVFDVPADPNRIRYPSESFLSFCFYCNKYIWKGKNIYMYRGERAFCSIECREVGMLMEPAEDVDDDDM